MSEVVFLICCLCYIICVRICVLFFTSSIIKTNILSPLSICIPQPCLPVCLSQSTCLCMYVCMTIWMHAWIEERIRLDSIMTACIQIYISFLHPFIFHVLEILLKDALARKVGADTCRQHFPREESARKLVAKRHWQ